MRFWIPFSAALFAASIAAAQAPVRVTARVVDRSTVSPIAGAGVRIDDVPTTVVSGADGILHLDVAPGRHRLVVGAAGYTSWQRDFDFRSDTSIVVDLGHEAFALDTVRAKAGTAKVKLTFRDSATNHLMVDVQATTTSEWERSSHTGTVTLHVPIGESTLVIIEAFPYLTVKDTLLLRIDTSFTVLMRINRQALALLEKQNAWFAERAHPRAVVGRSSFSNKELSAGSDATLGAILKREGFFTRLKCIVIDDEEPKGAINIDALMPEQVERVERMQFGPYRDVMIRVYTREYMRDVILGITKPHEIVFAGRGRICR
jgi:hypothetical protein